MHNFFLLFALFVFLLILPSLADHSTENGGPFGRLQESRQDAKNRPLRFVCFQGDFNSSERAPVLKECTGKVCVRSTHIQTGHVTLSCKDFIEFDETVGQCREIVGEQLPGQIDKICLCEGNFCNGVGRLKAPSLVLLLSLALAVPVLLLLHFGAAPTAL